MIAKILKLLYLSKDLSDKAICVSCQFVRAENVKGVV